jgi:hypothetical protein
MNCCETNAFYFVSLYYTSRTTAQIHDKTHVNLFNLMMSIERAFKFTKFLMANQSGGNFGANFDKLLYENGLKDEALILDISVCIVIWLVAFIQQQNR